MIRRLVCAGLLCCACACAHLDFAAEKGLAYYEPKPYLVVTTTAECAMTATLLVVPGAKAHLSFASGYGSSDLSVTLSNGMIQTAGLKTDTKIPETITALAGAVTAAAGVRDLAAGGAPPPPACRPALQIVPIDEKTGAPDWGQKRDFFGRAD